MKTKSKKLLYAIISMAIAGLLVCSVLLVRYASNFNPQTPEANLPEIDAPVTDGDGNELKPEQTHPMPKAMVFRTAAEQSEGITLTATLKPENATNQKVDFLMLQPAIRKRQVSITFWNPRYIRLRIRILQR